MSGIKSTHAYHHADGTIAFEVCLYQDGSTKPRRSTGPQKWDWSPSVTPTLYRLNELATASRDRRVFVVQDEPTADMLVTRCKLFATTDRMAHADQAAWSVLAERHVVVIARNDAASARWADQAFRVLRQVAKTIVVLSPIPDVAEGHGVQEWLFSRDTQDLVNLVKATGPLYERPVAPLKEPEPAPSPPVAAEPTGKPDLQVAAETFAASDIAPEIPVRQFCGICHRVVAVHFHVPNEIWAEAVHPSQVETPHCLACFVSRADEKLLPWDAAISFMPISLATHLTTTRRLSLACAE